MRLLIYVALATVVLMSNSVSALNNACDMDYVQLQGASIVVEPTGVDDTLNLQCAADEAVGQAIQKIKLSKGSFWISSLTIAEFNGTLSGVSKDKTALTIIDQSVDCQSQESGGSLPSAIAFIRGSPRLQNITISADFICAEPGDVTPALVSFSGTPTGTEDCSDDVVFGVIDRVKLNTSVPESIGVIAIPTGYALGGCKQTLLGTLKINRSEFTGFRRGVFASLRGGAQVDINYSTFEDNFADIVLPNTNQSTSILGNRFYGATQESPGYVSISIVTDGENAPGRTRFTVARNTFDIRGLGTTDATTPVGLYVAQLGPIVDLSVSIFENRFLLGDEALGVVTEAVDAGSISKNSFAGNGGAAVALGIGETPTSDWVITSNTFSGSAGIALYNTANAIIGPDQTTTILDEGRDSVILPLEQRPAGNGDGLQVNMPAEPNNANFMASEVTAPVAVVGHLSDIYDEDWIQLTPSGRELNINFQAELGKENATWQVEWFGPNGPDCSTGGDITLSKRNVSPKEGGFSYLIPTPCPGYSHKVVIRAFGPQEFLFDDSQYVLTIVPE